MKIYSVELYDVDVDENGSVVAREFMDADNIFYTTDIYEAFENFKNRQPQVHYSQALSLYEITLDCEDEEATSLDWNAYNARFGSVKESAPREIVAEQVNHEAADGIYFEVLDHMVRQSCRYFNMHEICKAAGVNYSTFRGFKNNRQYFSEEKLLAILRTMNRVGVGSWNEDLAADIETVKKKICEADW